MCILFSPQKFGQNVHIHCKMQSIKCPLVPCLYRIFICGPGQAFGQCTPGQQLTCTEPRTARANCEGEALSMWACSKHTQQQPLPGEHASLRPLARVSICTSADCNWGVDEVWKYYLCKSVHTLTQSMPLSRMGEEVVFLERVQILPPSTYTRTKMLIN